MAWITSMMVDIQWLNAKVLLKGVVIITVTLTPVNKCINVKDKRNKSELSRVPEFIVQISTQTTRLTPNINPNPNSSRSSLSLVTNSIWTNASVRSIPFKCSNTAQLLLLAPQDSHAELPEQTCHSNFILTQ